MLARIQNILIPVGKKKTQGFTIHKFILLFNSIQIPSLTLNQS